MKTKVIGQVLRQEIKLTKDEKQYIQLKLNNRTTKKDVFINIHNIDVDNCIDYKNKIIQAECFGNEPFLNLSDNNIKIADTKYTKKYRANCVLNNILEDIEVMEVYEKKVKDWETKRESKVLYIDTIDEYNVVRVIKIENGKMNKLIAQVKAQNNIIKIENLNIWKKNKDTKATFKICSVDDIKEMKDTKPTETKKTV